MKRLTNHSLLPAVYHVFDRLLEGVIVLNTDGLIVHGNIQAAQLLRVEVKDLDGQSLASFFNELTIVDENHHQSTLDVKARIAGNEILNGRMVVYQDKRGVSGNLVLSFFPLEINHQRLWLATFFDVSEIMRDRLHRSRFVRVIGHDLKNPLSSLKAYLYMIRKRLNNESEKTHAYLEQADEQINILTNMLNDLTDVSKISLQQFEVEVKSQPIGPLLKDIIARFNQQHPERIIKLSTSGSRLKAQVDAVRFQQLMSNILTNSIRYADPHQPIDISVNKSNQGVEIKIRDYGEGMSQEEVAHVFDPYYRTRYGYQFKGLGLGLSIAREIMHQHGGEIRIESSIGNGTTITLLFKS